MEKRFPKATMTYIIEKGFMKVGNYKTMPFGIVNDKVVTLTRLSGIQNRSMDVIAIKRSGFLDRFDKYWERDQIHENEEKLFY